VSRKTLRGLAWSATLFIMRNTRVRVCARVCQYPRIFIGFLFYIKSFSFRFRAFVSEIFTWWYLSAYAWCYSTLLRFAFQSQSQPSRSRRSRILERDGIKSKVKPLRTSSRDTSTVSLLLLRGWNAQAIDGSYNSASAPGCASEHFLAKFAVPSFLLLGRADGWSG